MIGGNTLISRSLLHEATNQLNKMFSSSSLKKWETESLFNKPQDKSFMSLIYQYIRSFLKILLMRSAINCTISILKQGILKSLSLKNIYDIIINKGNFQSAHCIASIPFINDLLHKLFNNILDVDSSLFTLIAGFLSALIGIYFEEKTDLVRFLILSITAKTIYSIYYCILSNLGYNPINKYVSYLFLLLVCGSFNLIIYKIPEFKPIHNIFIKYGLLTNSEKAEFAHMTKSSSSFPVN